MQSTGIVNHYSWKQGSSYILAAEHLRWGILSLILLPTYNLTRGRSQVDTIISSASARCKRVVLHGNEDLIIRDVFAVMHFCFGRRTNDVEVHQRQADFHSTYRTTPKALISGYGLISILMETSMQCANFLYNFLLLSQDIPASSSRCYWIWKPVVSYQMI